MRLGVLVPTRGVVMQSVRRPPVEECWTMARLADRAGYDAVWVGDSIVAKPRLEPLTTLAYLAGITTRVRLGTAVLLPALRHPVVLAHQIANVDQISGGRVVLGLGVGWSLPSAEREWAACGADHKRRVRRLEEHVAIWRMLWRGEPVTHRDGDVDLTDHTIGPLPWNAAGPPVLITAANRGEMLAAQFDRFGRLGDGIITTYVHAEECRLVRERAEEALARHGRAGSDFALCVYTTVRLEDDPRTAERVTEQFLATYYGGGVHSRGTMGSVPPTWSLPRSIGMPRPVSATSASGSSATISSPSSSASPPRSGPPCVANRNERPGREARDYPLPACATISKRNGTGTSCFSELPSQLGHGPQGRSVLPDDEPPVVRVPLPKVGCQDECLPAPPPAPHDRSRVLGPGGRLGRAEPEEVVASGLPMAPTTMRRTPMAVLL